MTKAASLMDAMQGQIALLGGGTDITGRLVEYWGEVWTVKGRNYIGDWDVERSEARQAGAVKITSSIAPTVLPEAHPHFARLVPLN
ncbi:hypothetical protein ACEPU1_32125 [Pseudomonas aeruginosa]